MYGTKCDAAQLPHSSRTAFLNRPCFGPGPTQTFPLGYMCLQTVSRLPNPDARMDSKIANGQTRGSSTTLAPYGTGLMYHTGLISTQHDALLWL